MVVVAKKDEVKMFLEYILWQDNSQKWTVRKLQAMLWTEGNRTSYDQVKAVLDEIVEDNESDPFLIYHKVRGVTDTYACETMPY